MLQEGQFPPGPRSVVDAVNRKNRPRATPGRKQPGESQDLAAEPIVAAKLVDDGDVRPLPGKLGRVTKLIQQGAPQLPGRHDSSIGRIAEVVDVKGLERIEPEGARDHPLAQAADQPRLSGAWAPLEKDDFAIARFQLVTQK